MKTLDDPNKKMAAKLRKAMDKKAAASSNTVFLYVLEKRGKYSFPYYAPNDKLALDAMKNIAQTVPDVARSNVWKIGSYCLLDGVVKSCKHTLILDK